MMTQVALLDRMALLEVDHEPDGWPAVQLQDITAMRMEIARLRAALRQVAQALAWRAFGECRSFGADVPLLRAHDADAVARVALGEFREGPNDLLSGLPR